MAEIKTGDAPVQMSIIPLIQGDLERARMWLKTYALHCLKWGAAYTAISAGSGWIVSVLVPDMAYLELFSGVSFSLFCVCVYRAHRMNIAKLDSLRAVTPEERTNLAVAIMATGALSICTVLGSMGLLTYQMDKMTNKTIPSLKTKELGLVSQSSAASFPVSAKTGKNATDKGVVEIVPAVPKPLAVSNKEVSKGFQAQIDYIARFSACAVAEQDKFGIPASITMAQAIIESASGTSDRVKSGNAHFGIKCFLKQCPQGHCSAIKHVYPGDKKTDRYRNYESAWLSFREHSKFFFLPSQRGRYKRLVDEKADYKVWAVKLQEFGYAGDKTYTQNLLRIIRAHGLDKLDTL